MNGHPNREGWFRGSASVCEPAPLPRVRAFRLVLLGPPGVGKGTQAELLGRRLRACHLSTGDLFRAAACDAQPTPAMSAALEVMRRGELVSDDLVLRLVRERSQCLRCRGGFLLDGVPRTLRQAEALVGILEELGVDLDAAVSYELDPEAIVRRIGGRRTCSQCKAVYHLTSRPPSRDGICDRCGGELMLRDDDRPETVRVRMRAYHEATQPVQDFYARRNELISIPAEGEPDEILQRTLRALSEHLGDAAR